MGLPRYHEQPVLCLMYRTIQNYELINQRKTHNGPFEVTQLINSFLSVLTHPWDQLLDKKKIKDLRISDKRFVECRFPTFPPVDQDVNSVQIDNAYELLRVLRNGLAHGNIEILDRKALRRLRPSGPLPSVKERDIAGLKIWNEKGEEPNVQINWCTALNVHELHSSLYAMMRLCEKRSLWKAEVHDEQEKRGLARRTKNAG